MDNDNKPQNADEKTYLTPDFYMELYSMLCAAVDACHNTVKEELEKPAGERDVYLMMGEERLSSALEHAIDALEASGIIDDEPCGVCPDCEKKQKEEAAKKAN